MKLYTQYKNMLRKKTGRKYIKMIQKEVVVLLWLNLGRLSFSCVNPMVPDITKQWVKTYQIYSNYTNPSAQRSHSHY